MDNRAQNERKSRSRRRWFFLGAIISMFAPPVGIGLIVANILDILPNIGGKVELPSLNEMQKPQVIRPQASPAAQRAQIRQIAQGRPVPAQAAGSGIPRKGTLISIFGAIAAGIGFIGGAAGSLALLSDGVSAQGLVSPLFYFTIMAVGGVTAIYGRMRHNKAERFQAYLKLIGDKTAVPIHYLADVMGIDYHKVIKDLREMITRGVLDPAWIDMKTYRLMRTEFTEEQVVRPAEKKEEAVSRSDRILRQIRADNDLIDDPEVSAKIDRIEDLTRKIFLILDKEPEKESQLYSFLNYYLPTTLKALENYARLESQGVETASIREAKAKINAMLDELAEGYEKQLDKLFENDVVDISADIEVMRQMLRKDGLTEDAITAATTAKR